MECITENGIRYYITPEGRFPSVTSILSLLPKPALENWRTILGKEADKIAAERAVVGSVCHYRILSRYSIRLIEPPKVFLPWKDLEKWLKELNMRAEICEILWDELSIDLEPLYVEHSLVSRKHRFAGTLDLLAEIDGENVIIDLKTSKEVWKEYELQLAAYTIMCEENGINVDYGMIVKLHPFNDVESDIIKLDKKRLDERGKEFLDLVVMFYEKEKGAGKL